MSKFKRGKTARQEIRGKLTGNGTSDNMMNLNIPPVSDEEHRIGRIYTAQNMLRNFGWRRWMEGIIEQDGTPVNV